MATKGRGEDSMLVHMTPHEVASLQALALKHGGSLTINPDTGLPEASFLKKLLPMIAGFALGPAGFGLMSAASAGLTVGAVTGLATGSLSKGLMAGLGAYGGAGLGEAFMNTGTNALASGTVGTNALTAAGYTPELAAGTPLSEAASLTQGAASQAPMADKLAAGFNAVKQNPMTFIGDNWKYGLAAAAPLLADAMVPTTVKAPPSTPTGYIRPFQFDENTRTVKAMDPVLASEWGTRSFPDYIRKTPQPPGGMNRGGIVALADGGPADPYAKYNTMSGQSKAAYDYLMGNAEHAYGPAITTQGRPVVSNTNVQPVTSTTPNEVQTGTAGTGTVEAPTQPYVPPTELTDPRDYLRDPDEQFNPAENPEADFFDEYTDIPDYIAPPDAPDYPDYIAPPDAPNIPDYIAPPDMPDYPDYIAPPDAPDIPDYIAPEDPVDKSYWDDTNSPDPVGPTRGQPELPEEFDQYIPVPDYIAPPDEYVRGPGYQDIPDYIAPPDDLAVETPDYIAPPDEPIQQDPVEILPDYIAPPDEPIQQDPVEILPDYIAPPDEPVYYDPVEIPDYVAPPDERSYQEPVYTEMPDYIAPPDEPSYQEPMREPEPVYTEAPAEPVYQDYIAPPDVIDYPEYAAPPDISPGEPAPVEETGYPYVPDYIAPPDEYPVEYTKDVGGGEYTGGGGGGYGGYDAYGGFEDYMNGYDPGYYGGGEGYSWNGEANGGLIGYARGGSTRPFFSKETGKFSYKPPQVYANGGYAMGGLGSLGGYSDGGRLLKGPGDGVSDSIPATIGNKKQPARLADGEFVVPARIVSELGNGSTEAGARKLYAMMDRIQKARGNTVGKGKVAANTRSDKHLPA
jgi:hypothetical protein